MKLAEIEQEAFTLSERERASLAGKLLDILPPAGTDVSDEEVERREQQLGSGGGRRHFTRGVRSPCPTGTRSMTVVYHPDV